MATISVFVVDDHELARRGIAQLLETDPGLTVVGEAATSATALARILATRPDVALLDFNLPDGDGVALCAAIGAAVPAVRCILLTAVESDRMRADAMAAGAAAFLLKDVRASGLIDQVKRAARGQTMRSSFAPGRRGPAPAAREPDALLLSLTARERGILELVAEGKSNRDIGSHLNLAEKTIKNNITSVLTKLNLTSRSQASAYLWKDRSEAQ
jgi:two-component system, NarL family, response regulator DevR